MGKDADETDKLLMLSAVFFALRLFTRATYETPLFQIKDADKSAVLESDALVRDDIARRSALDAKALLDHVKLPI